MTKRQKIRSSHVIIDLSTMQKITRLTITWTTIIYVLGYQIVSVNSKLSD